MNKIYFEFYRNDDVYDLSAGFYDKECIDSIKIGGSYFFYHPDSDEFQKYQVDNIEIGFYEGFQVVCASCNSTTGMIKYALKNLKYKI